MKITRKQLKKIILKELNKSTPFGSGMKQAKVDKDQKDIIGHTWLTHVKRKDSVVNEIGEVVWHSLDKEGTVKLYDVYWPSTKIIENNISASLLEGYGKIKEHEHESINENLSISKRKYKRGIMQLTRKQLRKLLLREVTSLNENQFDKAKKYAKEHGEAYYYDGKAFIHVLDKEGNSKEDIRVKEGDKKFTNYSLKKGAFGFDYYSYGA